LSFRIHKSGGVLEHVDFVQKRWVKNLQMSCREYSTIPLENRRTLGAKYASPGAEEV